MVIARIFTRIGSLIYCKPQNKDIPASSSSLCVWLCVSHTSTRPRSTWYLNDSNTHNSRDLNAISGQFIRHYERNRVSLIAFESVHKHRKLFVYAQTKSVYHHTNKWWLQHFDELFMDLCNYYTSNRVSKQTNFHLEWSEVRESGVWMPWMPMFMSKIKVSKLRYEIVILELRFNSCSIYL